MTAARSHRLLTTVTSVFLITTGNAHQHPALSRLQVGQPSTLALVPLMAAWSGAPFTSG